MKEKIIKIINDLSGSYPPHVVFEDWVKAGAIVIQNEYTNKQIDNAWEKREKEYVDILNKYRDPLQAQKKMAMMLDLLAIESDNGERDLLGEIYMEIGASSDKSGQFFTPFHISEMNAEAGLSEILNNYDGKEIELTEPSCGSGGMIIATAKILRKNGINYQDVLNVLAYDLEWRCVYMTYVQLSLYGINAGIIRTDALTDGKKIGIHEVLLTPRKLIDYAKNTTRRNHHSAETLS